MTSDTDNSNSTTMVMEKALSSGDDAYWPTWVNITLPILSIIIFLITVIMSVKCGQKKSLHIEVKVPVIVTKNDAIHSNDSIGKRSDTSDINDKKNEAQDKVSMLQKAKEQAKNSRAARRLNSIRSRVSSSSQYDYSPLEEGPGPGNQLEQDSSDEDGSSIQETENVFQVNVEHHSPPRNVLISSEDSGFNEASTRTSMSENA